MTSPDFFRPDNATQAPTIYKLGEVTQESVALQQTEDMRNMLQELFDTFFDNLFGGFGDVVGAIVAGINQFIHDLLMLLDGVTGGIFNIDELANTFNATRTTATDAQSTATSAQGTATAAQATANSASSTATAAQTAASNAASVAAAAQETADIAYENAQYNKDEFVVSSAGVQLGKNEETLGILMTTPAGRIRKITRVIYTLGSNTGTMTVQLVRRDLGGTESVVLTTNISSAAIVYPDNTIDYETVDLDHYLCNVTAIGGVANTLHCCIESVILEA